MITELNIPENFGEAIFGGPELGLATKIEKAGRLNGEFLSDEQIGKIQRGLRDKIALYRLDKIVPGRGKLDDVGAMACLLRNAALLAKVSLQSHLQQEPTPDVVEDLLGMKNGTMNQQQQFLEARTSQKETERRQRRLPPFRLAA